MNPFCCVRVYLFQCEVCSLQPCSHLMVKGWPFGYLVGDVYLCFCHFA